MKIITVIWLIALSLMAYTISGVFAALLPGLTISGFYLMEFNYKQSSKNKDRDVSLQGDKDAKENKR